MKSTKNLTLIQRVPITVMGTAMGNITLRVPSFPKQSKDVRTLGQRLDICGAGFDITRMLTRLGLSCTPLLTVGNGYWGVRIKRLMMQEGIMPLLQDKYRDNGWYITMIDAAENHSVITVEGCEAHWNSKSLDNIPLPQGIVYLSGHELLGDISSKNYAFFDFISKIPMSTIKVIDFGPYISDINLGLMLSLISEETVLSLNEAELIQLFEMFDHKILIDVATKKNIKPWEKLMIEADQFCKTFMCKIVGRFYGAGSFLATPDGPPTWIEPLKIKSKLEEVAGVSDIQSAGIIAGLSCGYEIDVACKLSNLITSMSIEGMGSNTTPSLAQVLDRLQM